MKDYIIRRFLQIIPVLVGISLVIFIIFSLAPGDAVSSSMNPKMTAQAKQEMRHKLHLDEPKIVQYGHWLKNVVRGDLGESFYYKQPVAKVINSYLWNSFWLSLISSVVAILLAIPLGVLSATKKYSFTDNFLNVLTLIGISLPSFFLALLLIKWFAVDLEIFPVSGMQSPGVTYSGFRKMTDIAYHMFLPFCVLTFGSIAGLMKYTRSSMLEVINQDYIRTARAKGLKEKVVIYKHALRNGLIPVITLLGFWLPGLFSGAIITEQVFNWPGIGPIQLLATNNRDYPLLMGLNMFFAILTLLGNLIADITYAAVDPRIRYK